MPFELPTDPAKVLALAHEARALWEPRNLRMLGDQDLYEMRGGAESERGELLTLNDGQALIHKAAAMIAAKLPLFRVVVGDPGRAYFAQRVKNALEHIRREFIREFARQVNTPLPYAEAQAICLRGWIAGRLMLRPERPEFPFRYDLLDPLQVYPANAGARPRFIAHLYQPTVAELLAEWPDAPVLQGRDPKETAEVAGLYTETAYTIVVDGEFLQPPTEHGYGFNPILLSLAAGAFYRQTLARADWPAEVGTGLLHPVRGPIRDKEELLAMLRTLLAKEAEPPAVLKTDTPGQIAELDLSVGGRNIIAQRDSIELIRVGPNLQNLMGLIQVVQDEIYRGALGPAAWAEGAKFASGFHESIAAGTARDLIFPYVRALELYYEMLYGGVLELYKRFGVAAQPLRFVARDPVTGQPSALDALDPQELALSPLHVEVQYRDVTPQNEAQRVQLAAILARDRLASLQTIRSRFLDIEDPFAEEALVLADLLYMDPLVTRLASLAAALGTDHPILRGLAQQVLAQQVREAARGVPRAGAQGAPPPAGGMPPEAVPPELGRNAGAPPGEEVVGPPSSTAPGQPPVQDLIAG